MTTPGPLALVGGDELNPGNEEQDRVLVEAAGGGPAYVLATTAGRQRPDLAVRHAVEWFGSLGLSVEELPATKRSHATSGEIADLARGGRFFYLVGGDPGLTPKVLADSPLWDAIVSAWRDGAALAGSSAGAMAMGEWTLIRDRMPGDDRRRYQPALAVLPGVAVLPHFETFGHRWVESAQAAMPSDGVVLLGVDERSAAMWRGGTWRAYGPGGVTVIAGGTTVRFDPGDEIDGLPSPSRSAVTRRYPGAVPTVYDLTPEQLSDRLVSWGEPAFRAKQVWSQLWKRAATYDQMSDVSPALREQLAEGLPLGVEVLTERTSDRGATRKTLLRLGGQHVVEAVLMGYPDRVTVCISSQAGCAMGCTFCATGQMGLQNNLTAGEIAAQAVWARRESAKLPDSTPQRLTNVVFMGMGEPFANQRHVFASLARLTDPAAFGLGARHITVSTVGIVPGIERLAERAPQVGLAVSFHAASDELRDQLVPPNTRYPLLRLERAIADWRLRTRRRPSIEWALIDRVNDTTEQAELLAPIAHRLGAHVNLIPLNPTPGYPVLGSPPARIRRFVETLERLRVNVTVRDTRGRSIDAACGQLALATV